MKDNINRKSFLQENTNLKSLALALYFYNSHGYLNKYGEELLCSVNENLRYNTKRTKVGVYGVDDFIGDIKDILAKDYRN